MPARYWLTDVKSRNTCVFNVGDYCTPKVAMAINRTDKKMISIMKIIFRKYKYTDENHQVFSIYKFVAMYQIHQLTVKYNSIL